MLKSTQNFSSYRFKNGLMEVKKFDGMTFISIRIVVFDYLCFPRSYVGSGNEVKLMLLMIMSFGRVGSMLDVRD